MTNVSGKSKETACMQQKVVVVTCQSNTVLPSFAWNCTALVAWRNRKATLLRLLAPFLFLLLALLINVATNADNSSKSANSDVQNPDAVSVGPIPSCGCGLPCVPARQRQGGDKSMGACCSCPTAPIYSYCQPRQHAI